MSPIQSHKHIVLFCMVLTSAFHSGVAAAQPQIEQRGLFTSQQASDQSTSQTWQMYEKIQALEAELQQLRDKVEVLETKIARDKKNDYKLIVDLEARVDNLENGLVDVMNTTSNPTNTSKANGSGASDTNPAQSLSDAEELKAKEIYVEAYKAFKAKGSEAGVKAMDKFIKTYPNSKLAANAHYWMGEFYLAGSAPNYDLAALSFQTVLNNYPDSEKTPTALYRLATLADADGNTSKAKSYAQKIIDRYPNAKEAKLAKAYLGSKTNKNTATSSDNNKTKP